MSDSNAPALAPLTATRPTNGRPATPTTQSRDEVYNILKYQLFLKFPLNIKIFYQQLERAREENRRLLSMVEEKDHQISILETHLGKVSFELTQANNEKSNLMQENSDLVRAISTLSAK